VGEQRPIAGEMADFMLAPGFSDLAPDSHLEFV
jgi:hypothetical protein